MYGPQKILIVSRSFYPLNSPRSFRTTQLVKEFARQGHNVTLLTLKNDSVHVPFEKKHGVTIRDLGPLWFPKINLNVNGPVFNLARRAVRRGLNLLFEYPDIELMYRVKKALRDESGYDLLISVAVPHPVHWGVAKAWRVHEPIAGIWAADCGDPYMGQTLDSFNNLFYFKYFEKDFCRKADYISVPLESAKDGYYQEFRDKIKVIPQGFNFDEVTINNEKKPENSVPTFAYAGSLIPEGRDPRQFLDYLVSQNRDFKFILFTKNRNLVEPYLAVANGRIEIREYLPRDELLQMLSEMDFLVNFENASELMMPSKLIEYYIVGRPVLSIPNSRIDKHSISQFLSGNYENQLVQKNMERYKIKNVCKQFLQLCHDQSSTATK